MSEVKTRKVRKTTNLGKILKKMEKIGGMVPAMPIAALPLSRMLATPQQTIPNRPDAPKEDYRAYLGIYGISLVVLLSDAYGPKKSQLFWTLDCRVFQTMRNCTGQFLSSVHP